MNIVFRSCTIAFESIHVLAHSSEKIPLWFSGENYHRINIMFCSVFIETIRAYLEFKFATSLVDSNTIVI